MSRRRDFAGAAAERARLGEGERDAQFVVAVERAFGILRCFRPDDHDLTNSEMVERTGLTKPTVSRLSNTLTQLGYLEYSERTGTYRLGAGLMVLASPMLSGYSIRNRARPFLRELAEQTRASVAIAARSQLDMVYIEHASGPDALILRFTLGSSVPLALTAMGKAYLSGLDQDDFAKAMAQIRESEGDRFNHVAHRITDAMDEIRRTGFCVSCSEWREGVNAVAVPVRVPGTDEVLALNCGGPAFVLTEQQMRETVGPRMVEIARELTTGETPAA